MLLQTLFDYQFRIIVIGDSSVGKTTLLRTFKDNQFSAVSEPTVGLDFLSKTISIRKDNVRVNLDLWDTAGQTNFRSLTPSYYRDSVGALLLYDITRRNSFNHLVDWQFEARKHIEPNRAVYQVVACKCDMADEREVTAEDGRVFADFYGFNFIETSAKTMFNVEQTFRMIAENIYDKFERKEFAIEDGWDGIKTCEQLTEFGTICDENTCLTASIRLSQINTRRRSKCCFYL